MRIVVICPHFAPDTAPTGTVMTRIVAELAGKRSGFAGGAVMALIGLVVVWTLLPDRNPARAEAPTVPSAPIR